MAGANVAVTVLARSASRSKGPGGFRQVARAMKPQTKGEAAAMGAAGGIVGSAAVSAGADYAADPEKFKQTFRDQAARDRENKARWKANKTPMRQRVREVREQNTQSTASVGKSMPNTVTAAGDIAKSNIREYPYLPEWVKDSFAATTVRNPLNATDLYAASRVMVRSQAAANGEKVRGRKLRRLTQAERRFAEGRMMLYSPLGRGSVTTL